MWKLFSGILSTTILTHLNQNQLLEFEQKGICPGSKGTKDQLLIEKMVGTDCKSRRTNLAVAWIDFQKAYDSVPHSWIVEVLKLYKINPLVQSIIKQSMSVWNTTLSVGSSIMGPPVWYISRRLHVSTIILFGFESFE